MDKLVSGNLTGKISVINETTGAYKATFIMTLYKAEHLAAVQVITAEVAANSMVDLEAPLVNIDISDNPSQYKLRMFLWDGLGTAESITTPKVYAAQ